MTRFMRSVHKSIKQRKQYFRGLYEDLVKNKVILKNLRKGPKHVTNYKIDWEYQFNYFV